MSFADSEVCAKIEARLEDQEFDRVEHHPICPMSRDMITTACFCKQLDKADKDAAAEAKMDLEDGR